MVGSFRRSDSGCLTLAVPETEVDRSLSPRRFPPLPSTPDIHPPVHHDSSVDYEPCAKPGHPRSVYVQPDVGFKYRGVHSGVG